VSALPAVDPAPPAADAATDAAPFLALDRTGSAVLVWSRSDGAYKKIAYARFSGGAWTDFHYLTFGRGDDEEPRIGTGRTGSFLFYAAGPDTYLFAPLELVRGRLFAAPRALKLGNARGDIPLLPGGAVTNGGVDAPVVTGLATLTPSGSAAPQGGPLDPGGLVTQGGTDVPVVSSRTKASAWGVASSGDCRRMVLVIPARDLKSVSVFRFAGGLINVLQRHPMPAPITETFGEETASSYLPAVCD